MNRGTLVRDIFLSQWFLIRSASHLQRSRSETLDPGRWVRAISVTFSTKRRKPQIDFSNFFPMQRIFIIYSITFGQYLTREQWTWNFFHIWLKGTLNLWLMLKIMEWMYGIALWQVCARYGQLKSMSEVVCHYRVSNKRCLWRWLIL